MHLSYFNLDWKVILIFCSTGTLAIDEDEMPNGSAIDICFEDLLSTTLSDSDDEDVEITTEEIEKPDDLTKMDLCEVILLFMILFNVSRRAMDFLLEALNSRNVDVPRSVYLLKKKCRVQSFDFVSQMNENIARYSLVDRIKFCIEKGFLVLKNTVNTLNIQINIDGLPLFHSSNLNLWPVLMMIKESTYPKPLPLAVFCGVGKPKLEALIGKFVSEVKRLQDCIHNVCGFDITIRNVVFICDAPARAYVQCIYGHSASVGCSYCRISGQKDFGMMFPYSGFNYEQLHANSRTDENYAVLNENNQILLSPVAEICKLRSCFPPEFMHCVCLGVVRKLCEAYFVGLKYLKLPCKLSVKMKDELSIQISSLQKYLPSEFTRKLRPVKEFVHYKAVEFRILILYLGPVIFKNSLPCEFYYNFLLLHYAIYSFCSPVYCTSLYSEAEGCIEKFNETAERLFCGRLQTYNTHIIRHLPEFVKMYGCLDSWSAFVYENYLGLLKRRLKCMNGMMQQTINNLNIMTHIFSTGENFNFSYTSDLPNNGAIVADQTIIMITKLSENNLVSGFRLSFSHDLYEYPYLSRNLGIGFYRRTNTRITDVKPCGKCIVIPYPKDLFLILPLVNSECYVH